MCRGLVNCCVVGVGEVGGGRALIDSGYKGCPDSRGWRLGVSSNRARCSQVVCPYSPS